MHLHVVGQMLVIQLQLATREDGNGPAKHQHSLGRMENGRWEAVDDERQENMRVAQTCGVGGASGPCWQTVCLGTGPGTCEFLVWEASVYMWWHLGGRLLSCQRGRTARKPGAGMSGRRRGSLCQMP